MITKKQIYIAVILVGILSLVFIINSLLIPTMTNSLPSTYYKEKVDLFGSLAPKDIQVAFVGDSITDNAEWHELFPNLKVINRGIQGDSVNGLYARLDDILATKSEKVFLMIGINDLRRQQSIDEIMLSYGNIVAELSNNHHRVFIQSVLHVTRLDSSINKRVNSINSRLETLSLKYKNTAFVNLNNYLSNNNELKSEFTFDGVHLNAQGYKEWKNAITELIYK